MPGPLEVSGPMPAEGRASVVRRLVAVIPAHNEQDGILLALAALGAQTRVPDRVIVVADNCVDATAQRARGWGAEVVTTVDNRAKKAGALNQFSRHRCRRCRKRRHPRPGR